MDVRPDRGWLTAGAPGRVAVVRALRLGDLLCTVPMLRAIRGLWPGTRVTLVGLPWARVLLERYPAYLDAFIEFPGWRDIPEREPDEERLAAFGSAARDARFDLAIQAHGSGNVMNEFLPQLHARRGAGFHPAGEPSPGPGFLPYPAEGPEPLRLLALARHLGADDRDPTLEFPVRPEDRAEAARLRTAMGIDGRAYACVHPGGSTPMRRWSSDGFARVGEELADAGLEVILTGTTGEAGLVEQVRREARTRLRPVAGMTSLGGLAALLANARLLVSNDTGVSHLAAALGVPSVVVFSGSDPERWAPLAAGQHLIVGRGRPDEDDLSASTGPTDGAPWGGPQVLEVIRAVRQQMAAALSA